MEITVAYEEEIPVLTMTGRFDAGGALAFDKTALTAEAVALLFEGLAKA
jgi:hypothetical protein